MKYSVQSHLCLYESSYMIFSVVLVICYIFRTKAYQKHDIMVFFVLVLFVMLFLNDVSLHCWQQHTLITLTMNKRPNLALTCASSLMAKVSEHQFLRQIALYNNRNSSCLISKRFCEWSMLKLFHWQWDKYKSINASGIKTFALVSSKLQQNAWIFKVSSWCMKMFLFTWQVSIFWRNC